MAKSIKLHHNLDILVNAFQIQKVKKCAALDEWLAVEPAVLDDVQTRVFEDAWLGMSEIGDGWNEEELKMKFLSFMFYLAQVEERGKIQLFYERTMQADINNIPLTVKCDCLIASPLGFNTPQRPYFFLQEFKKGKGDKYDPEAQMLAAMLIAQTVNNDQKPVFGAYIVGRIWYFATLQGNSYCLSPNFDAAEKIEARTIISILRKLKELITSR
jgi:hypothetical protein